MEWSRTKQATQADTAKAEPNRVAEAEPTRPVIPKTNGCGTEEKPKQVQSQAMNDATTMQAMEPKAERNDSLSDSAKAETIDCGCPDPTAATRPDESPNTRMGIERKQRTNEGSKKEMDDTVAETPVTKKARL